VAYQVNFRPSVVHAVMPLKYNPLTRNGVSKLCIDLVELHSGLPRCNPAAIGIVNIIRLED
jgi:hypothetical protein